MLQCLKPVSYGQFVTILAICLSTAATLPAGESESCCCDPFDACDCGPVAEWLIGFDVLILDRATPDSMVLMQDTTDPTRNLNADDFHFDWRAGWEVSLARDAGCGRRLAARLMSVDAWNAAASATTNSTTLNPLQINTNPPTFAPQVQTISSSYGSDLISLEMNYEADIAGCWSGLAGFRYIELDEHLHSDLNATPQFFTYDTTTRNRMYGFQTGIAKSILGPGCWTFEGRAKAGIFHNSESHTSVLDTGVVMTPAVQTADRTSFAGELRVAATYEFTDCLSARFGYDLLWLETVALASDQIPATNLFTGTGIAADGGVFYQGAFAGLELRR